MKIITINLPEKYLDAIKILGDYDIIPSRSEAIRLALRDFLSNELKMYQDLDEEKFKLYVRSNANAMKDPWIPKKIVDIKRDDKNAVKEGGINFVPKEKSTTTTKQKPVTTKSQIKPPIPKGGL